MSSRLPDIEEMVLAAGKLAEEGSPGLERFLEDLQKREGYPRSSFGTICDIFSLDIPETAAFAWCLWRAALARSYPAAGELVALCLALGRRRGEPLSLLLGPQGGMLLQAACDIVFGREPRLPGYLQLAIGTEEKCYHHSALLEQADAYINAAALGNDDMPAVLALIGPHGSGRKFLLAQFAAKKECTLLVADCARVGAENLPEMAGLAMLTGSLVCLDGYQDKYAEIASGLFEWFSLVLLSCKGEPAVPSGCRSMLVRTVGPLAYSERLDALRDLLGNNLPEEMLAHAAALSRMSVRGMVAASARIKADLLAGAAMTEQDLVRALNRESTMALSQNAELVVTGKFLPDLTLPAEQKKQVQSICDYARGRETVWKTWGFEKKIPYGQGLTALFYGASGTGKTLAASVVANELGLELYRVDLSRLISKYIGETQKNIGKIFDDAQGAECILFFDEADALFSRRSEVADANDRYANAEIAYLLQRTEQYDGIILMATNLLQNFDDAFRRRIGFMIHFPMPDEPLREQLWQGIFPALAPTDNLDYTLLAKQLEISGASIRAIALNAARMAAAESGAIDMARIVAAAKDEYRKLGKTFPVSLTMMFV